MKYFRITNQNTIRSQESNSYGWVAVIFLFVFIDLLSFSTNVNAASSEFNPQINYQAKLTATTSIAVADGSYNIRFKLYTDPTGGVPIWTESQCYSPDNGITCNGTGTDNRTVVIGGLFSTLLGSSTSFAGVDFNRVLYLGVEIGGFGSSPTWDGEMTPRKKLGAVPAAFYAATSTYAVTAGTSTVALTAITASSSDTLHGLSSSQFLRTDAQNATSTASTFLSIIQNGVGKIAEFFSNTAGSVLSLLANGNVGIGSSTPYASLSVAGRAGGTGPLFAISSSTASFATSTAFIVDSNGNVGIGLSSPNNLFQVKDLIGFDNNDFNSTLGYQAGKNLVSGARYNTYLGYQSGMSSSTGSTNAADFNTAIGYQTLFNNTTGKDNSALGYHALYSNTTGQGNFAIGSMAMNDNIAGSFNTAVGNNALRTNSDGYSNTSIGGGSLYFNTIGHDNVAIGRDTLSNNTTGSYNAILGGNAAAYGVTGEYNANTIIGYGAASNSYNVFSSSTFLGYQAGFSNNGNSNVYIGYMAGAYETGSNSFYLDNQDRANTNGDKTKALLYGTFASLSANQNLTVNAHLNVTGTSTFTGAVTLNTLNGVLQAKDGLVSASSTLSVPYGGTGTSTIPAYGQLLIGNAKGDYDLVSTTSLNILAASSLGFGTQGYIPYYPSNGLQALTATSSIFIEQNGFIGMGTTSPDAALSVFNTNAPQFKLAYDKNNYLTTAISSVGAVSLSVNGSVGGFSIINPQPTPVGSGTGTNAPVSLAVTGGTGGNSNDTNIGTGGIGGGIQLFGGVGGTAANSTFVENGGAGGAVSIASGIGGAATSPDSDFISRVGGAGGLLTLSGGAGGAATNGGLASLNTAGVGGNFILKGGVGGNASGATTNNGGAGGSVYLAGGLGGSGSSQNGGNGDLYLGYDSNNAVGNVYFGNKSSVFVASTSRFGIGTTSPFTKLSVAGNTYIGGNLTATGTLSLPSLAQGIAYINSANILSSVASSSIFGFTPISNQLTKGYTIVGDDNGVAQATSSLFISSAGNVGIGTTSPLAKLDILSTLGDQTPLFSIASSTNGAGTSTAFYVAANGNVGIGTANPGASLGVVGKTSNSTSNYIFNFKNSDNSKYITMTDAGEVIFNQNIRFNGGYGINSNSSGASIVLATGGSSSGNITLATANSGTQRSIVLSPYGIGNTLITNGNVGIGTTSPLAKLDILSTLGDQTPLFSVASSTNGAGTSTAFYVASNGRVGIGTVNPVTPLYVVGTTTVTNLEATAGFHIGEGTWSPDKLLYSYKNWSTAQDAYGVFGFRYGYQVNGPSNKLFGTYGVTNSWQLGNGNTWGWNIGVGAKASGDTDFTAASGTTTNAAAFYAQDANTSHLVNQYGVYIETPTKGINNWSIYTVGGNNYFGGNVGIGTTSPLAKLDILSTLGDQTPLFSVASSTNGLGTSTAFYIASNGNVGVGTMSPNYKLEVNGDINIPDGSFYRISSSGSAIMGSASNGTIIRVGTSDSKDLSFYAGGADKMFIQKTTGNVGIGTTTPADLLTVYSTSNAYSSGGLNIQNNSTNGYAYLGFTRNRLGGMSAGSVIRQGSNPGSAVSSLELLTNTSTSFSGPATSTNYRTGLRITSAGSYADSNYIQILREIGGAADITSALDPQIRFTSVDSTGKNEVDYGKVGALAMSSTTGSTLGDLVFSSNNNGLIERMRISGAGNVGIGTTTPGAFLTVNGTNSTSDLFLIATSTDQNILLVDKNGNVGIGATSPDNLLTVGSTPFRVNGAGNVAVAGEVPGLNGWELRVSGDTYTSGNLNAGLSLTTSGYIRASGNSNSYVLGNLGIGTTSPLAKLDILSTTNNQTPLFSVASSTSGTGTSTALYIAANGNVGIGTAVPGSNLEVTGTDGATNVLRITSNTNSSVYSFLTTTATGMVRSSSSANFSIQTSGTYTGNNGGITFNPLLTEAMRITGAGNVGIGTTSPDSILTVYSNSTVSGKFVRDLSSAYAGSSFSSNLQVSNYNTTANNSSSIGFSTRNSSSTIQTYAGITGITTARTASTVSGDLAFQTVNAGTFAEVLRMTSGGNVGIGTTSPMANLALSTPTSGIENVLRLNLGTYYGGASSNRSLVIGPNSINSIYTNNQGVSSALFIQPLSAAYQTKVVVGTTTLETAVVTTMLVYGADSTNSSRTFATRNSNNAETFTVLNDGRVGIGSTTPSSTLTVANGSLGVYNGAICADNGGSVKCFAALTSGVVYGDNSSFVASDVAENYSVDDPSIEAGDIVATAGTLSPEEVDKRNHDMIALSDLYKGLIPQSIIDSLNGPITKADSVNTVVLGVISTNPGVLLGDVTGTHMKTTLKPVALSGRVPVKVNNEGGIIKTGDRIALSSVAGVGKKAEPSDLTVGIALEDFNGVSGKINTFVNLAQADPNKDKIATISDQVNSLVNNISVGTSTSIGNPIIKIASNGNVGIGLQASTSPDYLLQVSGDVAAQSFVNISSIALKKDVVYLSTNQSDDALVKINSLKIANYHYNNEDSNSTLHLGLIAEESPVEILSASGKGVDLYKMTTYILAGMQAQSRMLDSLASSTKMLAIAPKVTIPDWSTEIATLNLKVDALVASSTEYLAVSSSTMQLLSSYTEKSLANSTTFIDRIADAVRNTIASSGNWIVSNFTAKIAYIGRVEADVVTVSNGFEMVDQMTGAIWCVQVSGGNLGKLEGNCTNRPATTLGVATSTPAPVQNPSMTTVTTSNISTPTTTSSLLIQETIKTVSTSTNPGQIIATSSEQATSNSSTSPEIGSSIQATSTSPNATPVQTPALTPIETTSTSASQPSTIQTTKTTTSDADITPTPSIDPTPVPASNTEQVSTTEITQPPTTPASEPVAIPTTSTDIAPVAAPVTTESTPVNI